MDLRSLEGLPFLQAETLGDSAVRVAVLDGPVDIAHSCFEGADLTTLDTLVQEPAGQGPMSLHGTHVASLLFGQPGSPVVGIAPKCRGLILPVFRDDQQSRLSQLDLTRAIEQAMNEGAHIISVSGGERSPNGEADGILQNALQLCEDNNVLVVAAVGNDGCECLQVPAALPSVLAVGAIGTNGEPLEANNWGSAYLSNGVLAPGEEIDGAVPGGGTRSLTGSSFATPVVAGVAALLLSIQLRNGTAVDPRSVGRAILQTASPCHPRDDPRCRRYLTGTLNIPAAHHFITRGGKKAMATRDEGPIPSLPAPNGPLSEISPVGPSGNVIAAGADQSSRVPPDPSTPQIGPHRQGDVELGVNVATDSLEVGSVGPAERTPTSGTERPDARPTQESPTDLAHGSEDGAVVSSADCGCRDTKKSYIFAIGTIGFDFGTEARRDGFRQQMGDFEETVTGPEGEVTRVFPANPYDPQQLRNYLARNPWASSKLIWTLNLDQTPIYALEAEVPFGMAWGELRTDGPNGYPVVDYNFPPLSYIHKLLQDAIAGQALDEDQPNYISRVSVPGTLTNRTVRLFSGQIVPVVVVHARGLYTWNESALIDAVIGEVQRDQEERNVLTTDEAIIRLTVRNFLDKVYHQFRNLGQSPPDRALNYAATNAFEFTREISKGFLSGGQVPRPPDQPESLYSLDTISVTKSPYCRPGGECWDCRLTFFDPENERRARVAYLFTIDVSDELPVSLAPTRQFLLGR